MMKKLKVLDRIILSAKLRRFTVQELLKLYIESKIGDYETNESFTTEHKALVDDLVSKLNDHFAEKKYWGGF